MRGCTSQTVLNTAIPSVPVAGSPNDLLTRLAGRVATKSVTLNDGAGAKFKSLFTINGMVEIVAIYGVFTDVTNVVTVSTCYLDLWDGAVAASMSQAAPGTDCSTATVNSMLVLRASSTTALTFLKSDQARVAQIIGGNTPYFGVAANSKNGVATTLRFAATEDAATNCAITFYCHWIASTPGSTLVAA